MTPIKIWGPFFWVTLYVGLRSERAFQLMKAQAIPKIRKIVVNGAVSKSIWSRPVAMPAVGSNDERTAYENHAVRAGKGESRCLGDLRSLARKLGKWCTRTSSCSNFIHSWISINRGRKRHWSEVCSRNVFCYNQVLLGRKMHSFSHLVSDL